MTARRGARRLLPSGMTTPDDPPAAIALVRDRWRPFREDDSAAARAGVSFDRTPAGPIVAPPGRVRVAAYHLDFDERPTCVVDVDTLAEALLVCAHLDAACTWNVDYANAYDDAGRLVASSRE